MEVLDTFLFALPYMLATILWLVFSVACQTFLSKSDGDKVEPRTRSTPSGKPMDRNKRQWLEHRGIIYDTVEYDVDQEDDDDAAFHTRHGDKITFKMKYEYRGDEQQVYRKLNDVQKFVIGLFSDRQTQRVSHIVNGHRPSTKQ